MYILALSLEGEGIFGLNPRRLLRRTPQGYSGLRGVNGPLVKLQSETVGQSGQIIEDADDVAYFQQSKVVEAQIP